MQGGIFNYSNSNYANKRGALNCHGGSFSCTQISQLESEGAKPDVWVLQIPVRYSRSTSRLCKLLHLQILKASAVHNISMDRLCFNTNFFKLIFICVSSWSNWMSFDFYMFYHFRPIYELKHLENLKIHLHDKHLAVCRGQVVRSNTWAVLKHPLLGGICHLMFKSDFNSPWAGCSWTLEVPLVGSQVASWTGRELDKAGSRGRHSYTGPALVLCWRIFKK